MVCGVFPMINIIIPCRLPVIWLQCCTGCEGPTTDVDYSINGVVLFLTSCPEEPISPTDIATFTASPLNRPNAGPFFVKEFHYSLQKAPESDSNLSTLPLIPRPLSPKINGSG